MPSWRQITLADLAPELGVDIQVPWFDVKDSRFFGGAKGDGVNDDSLAIQQAINAAGAAGGGVVLVPLGTYLIVAAGLQAKANVILSGAGAGSVLKKGLNAAIITCGSTETNFTLRDLTLDGNQAGGFTGLCVNAGSANDTTISGCAIKNASTNGLTAANASRLSVLNCKFSGNQQHDIFLNPTSSTSRDVKIVGNLLDGTGVGSANSRLQASPGAGGSGDCNGLEVIGNTVIIGGAAFGIEMNLGSGAATQNWVVANNVVKLSANALGGFSFAGVGTGSCTGNTVEVNGFNATTGCIEVAQSVNITVGNNTINGGTTASNGIIVDGNAATTGIVITGNVVNGFAPGASSAGIRVIANSASSVFNDLVISNNYITWGGVVTGGQGIVVNTNNASAHADRILLSGNLVRGNGAASSFGIRLNNNSSGVIDKCVIIGNCNTNVTTAIGQTGDTNTLLPAGTNQS